jgi:ATP-dependent DNA helicase RecQ
MATAELLEVMKRFWGYSTFRPLQEEAMGSVLEERDSLVILPTGRGKSLCFQAPAVLLEGMTLVISPLISLMKDQVDSLNAVGVTARCIHSGLTPEERRDTNEAIRSKSVRLLYVAPERVVMPNFMDYLREHGISSIVIDEAHCVSHWGHDFRPEYRALSRLREAFPNVGVHCYTATATPQVRDDIAQSLNLRNPHVLVGSPDRPNLVFSAERRDDELAQVLGVVARHPGESGIVYCITRKKVDSLCSELRASGHAALPYHAGMSDADRKANQEAFSRDEAAIIVATVAFGMGIDKPDVRYVVHTGMPKSVEHYQQESGRAGRDGLEAECRLLYSGGDYGLWQRLMGDQEGEAAEIARNKLNDMYGYCTGVECRHQVLMKYFGESLEKDNCEACDLCLGVGDFLDDALTVAQKIISGVVRLDGVAGPTYTALVLTGSKEERVVSKGHDQLSTWNVLGENSKENVRDWIEQLVSQAYLDKVGEYNILNVTPSGMAVLRGDETPRMLRPIEKTSKRRGEKASTIEGKSWEGVDRELFDALRALRKGIAHENNAPAFTVFGDAALRDMARRKPTTPGEFLEVRGVGEKKCLDFAHLFLPVIEEHT